jgi:hypothetical protein
MTDVRAALIRGWQGCEVRQPESPTTSKRLAIENLLHQDQ